jgi:branched-chain amino acid transport system substrate-binding protein
MRVWTLLCLCLLSVACGRSTSTGPIVLGHLKPAQNNDELEGIALAVGQIDASPEKQVLGRKIQVIHAEAGTTPDEVQGQTTRLLVVDKVVGLIGCAHWPQAEKMAQAAQSPLTPALSLNGYAGAPAVVPLFPVGAAPAERGRALARYVKDNLKAGKVLLIREADALVPALVARAFVDQFGAVVEHAAKEGEALDPAKAMGDVKPDAYVLCGAAKSALAWRAKLPDGAPALFGGEEADIAAFPAETDAKRPILAAVSFHPDDDSPAAQEFVAKFRERFGRIPSDRSALAFDAFNIWAEAARRAHSTDADKLREQLTKSDASFAVVTGTLAFGPNQTPKRAVFIVRVEGGQTTKMARFEPQ